MKPSEPQLLLVGPGALGGLFAARLGRRWSGLHVLDRREDRAAGLQERGFHVTGLSLLDWTPPPGRVAGPRPPKAWPRMDAILFFVKAVDFAAAVKAAAPVTGPSTALAVFSETVDDASLRSLGRLRSLSVLAGDRARSEGPGRIVHEASGDLLLDAAAPAAKTVALWLKEAGIPAVLDKKVADKRWLDLLAQVLVDVPAGLTDVPQKRLLEPPLAALGEKLAVECGALAAALGRPVSAAALRERRDRMIAQAPEAKSLIGRDLLRGRPTERAALLDPLLAAARRRKVPAPLLTSLDRLLRRLEKEGKPA